MKHFESRQGENIAMRLLLISFLAVISGGCATQPEFDYEPPEVDSIGILPVLNDDYEHVHQGVTIFGNEEKSFTARSMKPSGYLTERSKEVLEAVGYRVAEIDLPDGSELADAWLTKTGWDGYVIKSRFREPMRRIMAKHELDLLIVWDDYVGDYQMGDSNIRLGGTGLLTFRSLTGRAAYFHSAVRGFAIHGDPFGYLGSEHVTRLQSSEFREINSVTLPQFERQVKDVYEELIERVLSYLRL